MADRQVARMLEHVRTLLSNRESDSRCDEDLVRAFDEENDEGAFVSLVDRHGTLVLTVCRRVLRTDADACDAFQATFIILARRAGSMRRPQSLASWLHGVAFRTAGNARRAGAIRRKHDRQAKGRQSAANPAREAATQKAQALLHEEIERLPVRLREVFVLCRLENRGGTAAAAQLGVDEATLRSRLDQARKRLKQRLAKKGASLAAALGPAAPESGSTQGTVPEWLVQATVAGALAGTSGAATGLVPAPVPALVEAAARSVLAAKVAFGLILVVTVVLTAFGVTSLARHVFAAPRPLAREAAARPSNDQAPLARSIVPEQPGNDLNGDPLPAGALVRLGTVRFQNPGEVNALAVSPDGKVLATVGEGKIRIWNASTGQRGTFRKVNFINFRAAEHLLAFSPDSQRLFFPGTGGVVEWHLNSGVSRIVAGASTGPLAMAMLMGAQSVDVSPDGKRLAASTDGGLQIVELSSCRLLASRRVRRFVPPIESKNVRLKNDRLGFWAPYSLGQFSPEGKTLAYNAGDAPALLRLLDGETAAEQAKIELGDRLVRLAFSRDGGQIATTERDNSVRVYDVATGRCLHDWTINLTDPLENYTSDVAFSPDGTTLFAGATDHLVHRWDLRTGRELPPCRGHTERPTTLAFSPEGDLLYSAGWDASIRRWDPTTAQEQSPAETRATGIVASSPVAPILAWAGEGGALYLSDAATGKIIRTLTSDGIRCSALAFSRDGSMLAAGGFDHSVQVWDPGSGQMLSQWTWPKRQAHEIMDAIVFSADDKALITLDFRASEVLTWNPRTGARLGRALHADVMGADTTPDGSTLVTAGWDRSLRWWTLPDCRLLDTVMLPEQITVKSRKMDARLQTVAFSPDGRLLATLHLGGAISVWHPTSRKLLYSFPVVAGQCNVAFSPDGQWLTTGGNNGEVALWETSTGHRAFPLTGHESWVHSVAFSPDGRTLLTGAKDKTGLVWELRPRPGGTEPTDADALWNTLAGTDAAAAYRAIWRLADQADEAVSFLETKLAPVVVEEAHFQKLIADLVSDGFAERDAASRELESLGNVNDTALREALSRSLSPEKSQQLGRLLENLYRGLVPTDMRNTRAVRVLELIATPRARQLLEHLATGSPQARLTVQAKASLERLARMQWRGGEEQ